MAHHLKESVNIGKIIEKSGKSLVAVDDSFKKFGKGRYAKEWIKQTGQEILYNGYQLLFRVQSSNSLLRNINKDRKYASLKKGKNSCFCASSTC